MPTVVKQWLFASDAQGLADAGNHANIAFAHESGDGSPANGCVKFTTSTNNLNQQSEYARRASTGETWVTWGVPAGALVTSVQITGWRSKVQSDGGLTNYTLKARVVDSAGASVHSAGDLLSDDAVPYSGTWTTESAGVSRSINADKQAAATDVRLELQWTVTTQFAGTNVDARFDSIELTITYETQGVRPESPIEFQLFAQSGSNWLGKHLPPAHSCNFELHDRGGMGAGDIEIQAAWEDLDLDGNEFLDIYLFGRILYRGWVRVASRDLESPEYHRLQLQSAVEILNHIEVRWKLAYGGAGADLATIAGDLITDFVADVGRFGSFVTQDMDATGITLTEFDARGMSVAQALNKLCDHASGNAIWGMEADWDTAVPPLPIHRIYFRPRPATTSKFYSVGRDVTGFVYPKDTGTVINVVNLTGGPVKQPNIAYNPSFEEIAPASETVGNLLLNHSFEDDSGAGTNWTITGTIKFTGGGADHRGSPRDGKYWAELDTNGEKVEQTVRASYTNIYTGIAWVRQETAGTGRQVKLTVEGLNSGGSVVISADTGFVTADDDWEKITVDLDPTAQSSVVQIRYRVETNGGGASNDGVLVDFTGLIEKNGEGAVGWRRIVAGNADPTTFQWNYKPATDAYHGGYVVRSDPASIAAGSDYVEIRTAKDRRIEVDPNERYSLIVSFYPTGNPVDVTYGITEYDSSGAVVATNETATDTINGAWETVEFWTSGATDGPGLTTNANTRSVELFVRHRDNDEVYIDGIFFCKGAKPPDVLLGLSRRDYWTGENYERRFRTDDSLFTGDLALSAAADASITTYGEREASESNELVTDYDTATPWAQDYFNAYAVPSFMAKLNVGNLESADELLEPTNDKVQIHGLVDAPDALSPVRMYYSVRGDIISLSADLGSPQPTYEDLFRIVQDRAKTRAF